MPFFFFRQPGGRHHSYALLYLLWIDVILTSDHSLLNVLERRPEGREAVDRLCCHIFTVLHSYHRTDLVCLRHARSCSLWSSVGATMSIDVQTFTHKSILRPIKRSPAPFTPISEREGDRWADDALEVHSPEKTNEHKLDRIRKATSFI